MRYVILLTALPFASACDAGGGNVQSPVLGWETADTVHVGPVADLPRLSLREVVTNSIPLRTLIAWDVHPQSNRLVVAGLDTLLRPSAYLITFWNATSLTSRKLMPDMPHFPTVTWVGFLDELHVALHPASSDSLIVVNLDTNHVTRFPLPTASSHVPGTLPSTPIGVRRNGFVIYLSPTLLPRGDPGLHWLESYLLAGPPHATQLDTIALTDRVLRMWSPEAELLLMFEPRGIYEFHRGFAVIGRSDVPVLSLLDRDNFRPVRTTSWIDSTRVLTRELASMWLEWRREHSMLVGQRFPDYVRPPPTLPYYSAVVVSDDLGSLWIRLGAWEQGLPFSHETVNTTWLVVAHDGSSCRVTLPASRMILGSISSGIVSYTQGSGELTIHSIEHGDDVEYRLCD